MSLRGEPASELSEHLARTRDRVLREFPEHLVAGEAFRGELTLWVLVEGLLDVLRFLRDDAELDFHFLADLTACDFPNRPRRFDIVYHLLSHGKRTRVRVMAQAAEGEDVPSVTSLFPTADFLEREVFDLFGVRFAGHPDLRRIMMPDDWEGHPLRKDYPLGFREIPFSHHWAERGKPTRH